MSFSVSKSLSWEKIHFFYPPKNKNSFAQLFRSLFSRQNPSRAKKLPILNNTSLHLTPGTCYGLLSPNGSGKTTLFRLLSSILSGAYPRDRAYKTLPFIDSTAPFITNLSIELNIKIFQNLYHYPENQEAINEILLLAKLESKRKFRIDQLSSGMISRLCLALFEFNHADLYLIDEILSFGDRGIQQKLIEVIQKKKSQGAIVIISGHNVSLLKECCDQGLEIDEGEIKKHSSLETLIELYTAKCSLS